MYSSLTSTSAASQDVQLVCKRFRSLLKHPTSVDTWGGVSLAVLNIQVDERAQRVHLSDLVRWLLERRRGEKASQLPRVVSLVAQGHLQCLHGCTNQSTIVLLR